jgi:predicted N-acetyltransferase YhbS
LPIERLTRAHNRKDFDCGEPPLNNYLKTQALQHSKQNFGDTFVLVENGSADVIGYYTVGPSGVEGALFPDDVNVPRLSIPVILLGRLAVDSRYQFRGLGEELLLHSLKYAVEFEAKYPCFAVCLDALNEAKRAYYAKRGFTSLLDNPLHMFLTIKKIEKLGLLLA